MISSVITNFLSFVGSFLLLSNFNFSKFVFRYKYYTFVYAPIFAACLQSQISIIVYYVVLSISLFSLLLVHKSLLVNNFALNLFTIFLSTQLVYSAFISIFTDATFSYPDIGRYLLILVYLYICSYISFKFAASLSTKIRTFLPILAIPLVLSIIYYSFGIDMQSLRISGDEGSALLEAQRSSLARRFINTFSLQFTYTNVGLLSGLSFVSALLLFKNNLRAIFFAFICNLLVVAIYVDKSSALSLTFSFVFLLITVFFSNKFWSSLVLTWNQFRSITILILTSLFATSLGIYIFSLSSALYLGDITLSARFSVLQRFFDVYLYSESSLFLQFLHLIFGHGLFVEKTSLSSYLYILDTQGAIDPYWFDIFFAGGLFGFVCTLMFFLHPFLTSLKNNIPVYYRHVSFIFLIFYVTSLSVRQLGDSSIMMLILSFSILLQSYISRIRQLSS